MFQLPGGSRMSHLWVSEHLPGVFEHPSDVQTNEHIFPEFAPASIVQDDVATLRASVCVTLN